MTIANIFCFKISSESAESTQIDSAPLSYFSPYDCTFVLTSQAPKDISLCYQQDSNTNFHLKKSSNGLKSSKEIQKCLRGDLRTQQTICMPASTVGALQLMKQ